MTEGRSPTWLAKGKGRDDWFPHLNMLLPWQNLLSLLCTTPDVSELQMAGISTLTT